MSNAQQLVKKQNNFIQNKKNKAKLVVTVMIRMGVH